MTVSGSKGLRSHYSQSVRHSLPLHPEVNGRIVDSIRLRLPCVDHNEMILRSGCIQERKLMTTLDVWIAKSIDAARSFRASPLSAKQQRWCITNITWPQTALEAFVMVFPTAACSDGNAALICPNAVSMMANTSRLP